MSKFDREFDKATKKINSVIEKTVRGAVIDLFSTIVLRTPVGNPAQWKGPRPKNYRAGSLRGNWQVQISTPASGILQTEDKTGNSTVSSGTRKINQFTLQDGSIWFSNNLPYAEAIEYGRSKQAPTGMVRTSVKAWQPIMNKIASKYKL